MYPTGEYRTAFHAARLDQLAQLGCIDDYSWNVPILERSGYLPRDRARVEQLVARATELARRRDLVTRPPVRKDRRRPGRARFRAAR